MFTKALTVLSLTAAVLAAPTSLSARQAAVTVTLIDATQHKWPITISSVKEWTPTNVVESISHVSISNTGYIPCTFYGVDGAIVVTMPGEVKEMDVGAPQTIVGGICGPCTFE